MDGATIDVGRNATLAFGISRLLVCSEKLLHDECLILFNSS